MAFTEADAERLIRLSKGTVHQLNNLLTGAVGYTALALDELPEEHPVRPFLEEIAAIHRRAMELSRRLQCYAGMGSEPSAAGDLNAAIHTVVAGFETPAQIEVALQLEPGLPVVPASRGELREVIRELLANSAEALDGSPGSIRIATRTAGPATVLLEVEDNGPGMDPATAQLSFDPFFSTRRSGRGLGLAVVAGIARRVGAAISVATSPGAGASFTVRFPRAG